MSLEERKSELLRLINDGFVFEVVEKKQVQKHILAKPKTIEVKHEFKIKELPYSTLDRISLLSLEMEQYATETNEKALKREAVNHRLSMAKIIAIAVLSTNYTEKGFNRLTQLFYDFLKPSDVNRICQLIDIASNLGDFINSIRLVTAANTVQKEKEAERIDQESQELLAQ
ncbi:hypothetical protein [Soonwooa purpurea]